MEYRYDEIIIERKKIEQKMLNRKRWNVSKLITSKAFGYSFLIFYSFVSLWPFIWSLGASFKNPTLLALTGLNPFPTGNNGDDWTLQNYDELFSSGSASVYVQSWIGNTITYSLVSSLINTVLNLLGGYALAQIAMKGKKIIVSYFMASIVVPSQATFLPTYFMYSKIGIISDDITPNMFIFAIILSGMANIIMTFMARQFFLTQTAEMEEASKMEGYSQLGVFFRITIRKMLPLFATQFVLVFMGAWNNFLTFRLFANGTPEKMTINSGITELATSYIDKEKGYGVMLAMSNISFIPMMALYGFSLKIQLRGIKGGNK